MIPILYESNEIEFVSNGLGRLSDAVSCFVTEEKNGIYELEMEYPVKGIHFKDITLDRIIYATPSIGTNNVDIISNYLDKVYAQPFDIYKITKPIAGVVTIYARHISYRTRYFPVLPFSVKTDAIGGPVQEFASNLNDSSKYQIESNNPFTLIAEDTRKWPIKEITISDPRSYRECILGRENSFISVFGGEIEFDKFTIYAKRERGVNNNVRIAYSKNITDFTKTEDASEQVTSIFPYWQQNDTSSPITLKTDTDSGIVYSKYSQMYPYNKTVPVDFKSYFNDQPSLTDLRSEAEKYIEDKGIGKPANTIKVSFVALWQTVEYANIAPLEEVRLCDTVRVEYPEYSVYDDMQVVETVYDVLNDRYKTITLGDATTDIATKVSDIQVSSVNRKIDKTSSYVEDRLLEQAAMIDGAHGGYIEIIRDDNGRPIEIQIKSDMEGVGSVIKMNSAGIGYSANRGQTPVSMWTIDGEFNAQTIGAHSIHGDKIQADTLKSGELLIAPKESEIKYVQNVSQDEAPEWRDNTYYGKNSEGVYYPVSAKPENWNSVYTDYYTQTKPVFGSMISIGYDTITNKPMLVIRAADDDKEDSLIKLIQTNNRVSFVQMVYNGNVHVRDEEVAYISNNRFYAPAMTVKNNFELNGYQIDRYDGLGTTNTEQGIVFRWKG